MTNNWIPFLLEPSVKCTYVSALPEARRGNDDLASFSRVDGCPDLNIELTRRRNVVGRNRKLLWQSP